ncbi:hypothetical protein IIA79_06090, partial [bacterium]|nr:hypothetical protein [bacterium]
PVAGLSVTPDFAGAPAEITLDASASYDPDGTIAEYQWDFDADGIIDWTSTDPVQDTSSDGTVTNIKPGAQPGLVTVTYSQGSAEWYYPSVVVTDDEAAESQPSTAKLGISGWRTRIVNTSFDEYELLVTPELAGIDPVTYEVVIIGHRLTPAGWMQAEMNALLADGVYLARQVAKSEWEYELIDIPTEIDGSEHNSWMRHLFWDEHNQPLMLFLMRREMAQKTVSRVWSAQRRGLGTWDIEERFYSSNPEHVWFGSSAIATQNQPGKVVGIITESLTDQPSIGGGDGHSRNYLVTYEQGTWQLEYTGYDTAEREELPYWPLIDDQGEVHALFMVTEATPSGIWRASWQVGTGLAEPQRLDDGTVFIADPSWPSGAIIGAEGTLYTVFGVDVGNFDNRLFYVQASGATDQFPITEDRDAGLRPRVSHLHLISGGVGCFVTYRPDYFETGYTTDYYRLVGDSWLIERLVPERIEGSPEQAAYVSSAVVSGGPVVAFIKQESPFPYDDPRYYDFQDHFRLAERLDPRLNE